MRRTEGACWEWRSGFGHKFGMPTSHSKEAAKKASEHVSGMWRRGLGRNLEGHRMQYLNARRLDGKRSKGLSPARDLQYLQRLGD
jgi:hypothetical protein